MKIKNKSLTDIAYVYKLGNLKIFPNTIVDVPPGFTEAQVLEGISYYPYLVLIEGSTVTIEDILYGLELGNSGVMSKDTYDTDYNNTVDVAEVALVSQASKSSLELEFDFNDFPSLSKNIGETLLDYNIENTKIVVDTPFDGEAFVSVGDDIDNERLMQNNSSNLNYIGTYVSENTYNYTAGTMLKLYLSGNPTVGSGKVIIFMS